MTAGADLPVAAARLLESWRAPSPEQEHLRRRYLAHLRRHPDAVWKHGPPAHLTASCFVLDATGRHALLSLHRKGGFWVQLGGHCEPGDADLAATAEREAREESGVEGLRMLPGPVDLHAHALGPSFGRCREHLDVAFAAVAPAGSAPRRSEESDEVGWWPVDDLPDTAVADLPPRLARVAALLAAQSASSGVPSSRAAATPSR